MQPRTKGQEIAERIERFTRVENPMVPFTRGYAFDHIVLGDFNLGHHSIYFCGTDKVVVPWLKDRIKEIERYGLGDDNRAAYVILEAAAILEFLIGLMNEAEKDLEEAQDILQGS